MAWELNVLQSVMSLRIVLYLRAMSSPANKEQFLKQFEHIVEGVKQNKMKVKKKNADSFKILGALP